MARRRARARRVRLIHESTPEGNWKILTLMGTLSLDGMVATMIFEAAGAELLYLPLYSPPSGLRMSERSSESPFRLYRIS